MRETSSVRNSWYRATLSAAALTSLLLCGCDNYSFVDAGQKVYRVNKLTGSVSAVDGVHISDVTQVSNTDDGKGSTAVTRNEITLPSLGNLRISFQRKWREGSMFYIANLTPFSGKLKAARENRGAIITLEFEDQDGFDVYSLPLIVDQMTQVVDEKNTPMQLEIKGNLPLSKAAYQSITGINAGWHGFPND